MTRKAFDKIWFVIPEDGTGPSFGPVLDRAVAEIHAQAMPGYLVGVDVLDIDFTHTAEGTAA